MKEISSSHNLENTCIVLILFTLEVENSGWPKCVVEVYEYREVRAEVIQHS